jgi:MFS family permease
MNNNGDIKLYGYRWIIFVIFFLLNFVMQLHQLTFATITVDAAKLYGVKDIQINLFAIVFLIAFFLLSVPVSLFINKFGIRIGVGAGGVLLCVFSLVKCAFPTDYNMMLVAQIGLSIAQPFIVNACTRVSAVWFPIKERATITGVFFLAQFAGMFFALGATPFIVLKYGISSMLLIYSIASLVSALLFFILIREKPPTPPCHKGHELRINTREGLKLIFHSSNIFILSIMFFIGLGIFNAISVCLEQVFRKRGFTPDEVGILGMLMIIGGILGAIFWPYLSDRYLKRKPFVIICWFLFIPCIAGIAFVVDHTLAWISCFAFGFILLGVGPLGFQYGAEASYPAPEPLSQGILQLCGQLSGIIFVLGMNVFGDYNQEAMVVFLFLAFINLILSFKLKESTILKTD